MIFVISGGSVQGYTSLYMDSTIQKKPGFGSHNYEGQLRAIAMAGYLKHDLTISKS